MADERFDERTSHVVGRAADIVAAQADCDVIEAFDRLKARAAALRQPLETTALDVIDGVLHFHPERG